MTWIALRLNHYQSTADKIMYIYFEITGSTYCWCCSDVKVEMLTGSCKLWCWRDRDAETLIMKTICIGILPLSMSYYELPYLNFQTGPEIYHTPNMRKHLWHTIITEKIHLALQGINLKNCAFKIIKWYGNYIWTLCFPDSVFPFVNLTNILQSCSNRYKRTQLYS